MTRWPIVALLLAFAVSHGAAQQTGVRDAASTMPARTGSASIAGLVVDALSSQPVRRATVVVTDSASSSGSRLAVTDDHGRFAFEGLPSGRYVVTATKAAYLPTAFGVSKPMRLGSVPTGTAIALTEGEKIPDVTLRITRGGVITGTVHGSDGRPARRVGVGLVYVTRAPFSGERTLASVPSANTFTDARGVYRIYGLPPGEYIAAVAPTGGPGSGDHEATTEAELQRAAAATQPGRSGNRRPTFGYAPMFYPGTTRAADASPIVLSAGEERAGVDFRIQVIPQSRVTGIVTGVDGKPADGATVRLLSVSSYTAGALVPMIAGPTEANGQFTLRGVPAGEYTVEVRWSAGPYVPNTSSETGWARTTIAIAPATDARLDLVLQPGRTVSGQITIDPAATGAPPDLGRMTIPLLGRDGTNRSTVSAAGKFAFMGLTPDNYRFGPLALPSSGATPWVVKSATINGRDAIDALVSVGEDLSTATIVLTNRVSEVTGTILDGSGRPAPEYFLVIFPADRLLWTWQSRRIQQARPAHNGEFLFRNLPPGEYLLGAVTDVEQNQVYEPEVLGQLLGASVKVTLAEGEKKVQHIRIR